MFKLGTLKLRYPIILAPMAGISDFPFRMLNRKFGCELAFVEMINVRSLSHKSKKTKFMLSGHKKDRPLGIQLLGYEEKYIRAGLDVLNNYSFDILDFNAACPARKVTKRGEGASLLKEPKRLQKLLKVIVKESKVPVTVKIRIGFDKSLINAKDVALICQDAGIDGLFVHGRTKEQMYSGCVNYKIIKDVKKALHIPVIASGDIFSAQLAKKMFDETGCDAVNVARGAFGNPWIFPQIQSLLNKEKEIIIPTKREIVKIMKEHINACIDFYGERGAVVIFRKFFAWYTKGFTNVRHLRDAACKVNTHNELLKIIDELVIL